MNQLKNTLLQLLNIQGASGREEQVAAFVTNRLNQLNYIVEHDDYGNVLAVRNFGKKKEGPVLLLSAHMDTVVPFVPGRKIVWDRNLIRSSEGILGADDRAGIAIILEVIDRINNFQYNGTLKIAFTRDEERGRIGSKALPAEWLADVEMAIVADRRNLRDIVTCCGNMAFCPDEVGEYWEMIGARIGQPDWKVCQGGISDVMTFAEHGIPSINLSCGYMHEHTDWEELHWPSLIDTACLITEGIMSWRCLTTVVRRV